jgi:hypothetical protein
MESLPCTHSTYDDARPVPIDPAKRNYWLEFQYGKKATAVVPCLLGEALQDAVSCCKDVRRILVDTLLRDAGARLQRAGWYAGILPKVFPRLKIMGIGQSCWVGAQHFQMGRALWDMVKAVGENGQVHDLRKLSLLLCRQRPLLLKDRDFIRGMVKLWLGSRVFRLLKNVYLTYRNVTQNKGE